MRNHNEERHFRKMRQNSITCGVEVRELALVAGRAIMDVYSTKALSSDLVHTKIDDSPLTCADLAANEILCRGLYRLTPAIPVVSEEDEGSQIHRTPYGHFWLIDPLDGTKEFLSRNGEFTVNVALIEDGHPVWGVVYAPALDTLYWGGAGGAAYRSVGGTVETINVSTPRSAPQALRVIASKSHLNHETSEFIARLGATELVQAGSSLKFCRIAEGQADIYPRLAPTAEWDTAAAQAVLEAAGGYVVDTAGVRLRYGKADIRNPHFIAGAVPLSEVQR